MVGIAASKWSFAAVHANGAVTHWGKPLYGGGRVPGYLGRSDSGKSYDYASPGADAAGTGLVNLSGIETLVVSIASADRSFAALHSNGAVTSWGEGQYANTLLPNIPIPDRVTGPTPGAGVVSIASASGAEHFAALHEDGTVSAWGGKGTGDEEVAEFSPALNYTDFVTAPAMGADVVSIVSTRFAFAAIHASGRVTVWGFPALGGGSAPSSVTSPSSSTGVSSITASEYAFAALHADGSVSSWGAAGDGVAMDPTPVEIQSPIQGSRVSSIASTKGAFAALLEDGSVTVWGIDSQGGDNGNAPSSVTSPSPGAKVSSIVATADAFVAMHEDGSVSSWGGSTNYPVPASVTNSAGTSQQRRIRGVAANGMANTALHEDGTLSSWGHGAIESDTDEYGGGGVDNSMFVPGAWAVGVGSNANYEGSTSSTPGGGSFFALVMYSPCSAGTKQPQSGTYPVALSTALDASQHHWADACVSCDVGTASSIAGQPSCTNCSQGMYQNATGQSSCQSCGTGTYQNVEGQTGCQTCPRGTSQPAIGQVSALSCIACDAGKFQLVPGGTACTDCPEDTYAGIGAASCLNCTIGFDCTGGIFTACAWIWIQTTVSYHRLLSLLVRPALSILRDRCSRELQCWRGPVPHVRTRPSLSRRLQSNCVRRGECSAPQPKALFPQLSVWLRGYLAAGDIP